MSALRLTMVVVCASERKYLNGDDCDRIIYEAEPPTQRAKAREESRSRAVLFHLIKHPSFSAMPQPPPLVSRADVKRTSTLAAPKSSDQPRSPIYQRNLEHFAPPTLNSDNRLQLLAVLCDSFVRCARQLYCNWFGGGVGDLDDSVCAAWKYVLHCEVTNSASPSMHVFLLLMRGSACSCYFSECTRTWAVGSQ